MKKTFFAIVASLFLFSSTAYGAAYAIHPEKCIEWGFDKATLVTGPPNNPFKGMYVCQCNEPAKQTRREIKLTNLIVNNKAPERMFLVDINNNPVTSMPVRSLNLKTPINIVQGQTGNLWNLGTLQSGRFYPTTISVKNISCKGKQSFTVSVEDSARLKLIIPESLKRVQMGQTSTVSVWIDLRGIAPGEYNDKIIIQCVTCPPPPKCVQDITLLQARVVVK